jgi:hypothetical protein
MAPGPIPEDLVAFYRHALSVGTLAADGRFDAVAEYLAGLELDDLFGVAVVLTDLATSFAPAALAAHDAGVPDPPQSGKSLAWARVAAAYWQDRDPY